MNRFPFITALLLLAAPQAQAQPDTIKAELDIAYADTDNARQRLDLYLPKKPEKPLPVIAFIHCRSPCSSALCC